MSTGLKDLQNWGFIDWMSVYIAWKGLCPDFYWLQTTIVESSEVKDYALDKLADYGGTESESTVFELADADLTDWLGFERKLTCLANRSGVWRESALRKWRFVDVASVVQEASDSIESDDIDWVYEDICMLQATWDEGLPGLPLPLSKGGWTREQLKEDIATLSIWLVREKSEL